jgi:hypothetical protein
MERMKITGLMQAMRRLVVAMLPALVLALPSCLKDQMPSDNIKKLQIVFNGQTIGYAEVDSGFTVLRNGSSSTAIIRNLERNGSTLEVQLGGLSNDYWIADTYLYTKKDTANKSYEYHFPTNFNPGQIAGILVPAPPNSSAGSAWTKNVILSTPDNSIITSIPLDLTDPNFLIRTKNVNWNSFSMKKNAWFRSGSNNQLVETQTWNCAGGCVPAEKSMSNSQAFASFAESMKTKAWNNADVTVRISDTTTNTTYEFTHAWNKP